MVGGISVIASENALRDGIEYDDPPVGGCRGFPFGIWGGRMADHGSGREFPIEPRTLR